MASAPTNRHKDGVVTVYATHTTATNLELVAAPAAGIKIRVISVFVSAAADNTVTFTSDAVAATNPAYVAANGGYVLNPNEAGWFETTAGEALGVTLGFATAVGLTINYKLSQV